MPLFPLDHIRNAPIRQELEPALQDLREQVSRFTFVPEIDGGDTSDVLDVFDMARPRLNVLLSRLKKLPNPSGADISTGIGFLGVLLQSIGISVTGTEVDPATSRFASAHGVEIRPYCIGRTPPPFDPASLDFLVFGEVLEHLNQSPIAVLSELIPLLRPGGCFVLTTPNIARLENVQALAAGENFLEPFPEDIPRDRPATDFIEHVREYSVREVVEATEAAGLCVDEVVMTGWGSDGYHPRANPYANQVIVLSATRPTDLIIW